MAWPSVRAKTATVGGSWVPADMNAVQDQYLRATGILDTDLDDTTVGAKLGLSNGATTRRGKAIIATTEARTNVAYGTLTTPDQVTVTLPTDGLIAVAYQAAWQESVSGTAKAAIFIGANQLKTVNVGAAPALQDSGSPSTGVAINTDAALGSGAGGLYTGSGGPFADVTTGQTVGAVGGNGPCYIFAAAGTYIVSVQFKASSGTVTVKNRKLWVWTLGF